MQVWSSAIESSPEPPRVARFLQLARETELAPRLREVKPEQARILGALISGSEAAATLLLGHPEWLEWLNPERLAYPRRAQGLQQEMQLELRARLAQRDFSGALAQLRRFKQRELVRIAARDLARLGSLREIMLEISDVADTCLEAVWQVCFEQLSSRYGRPYHQGPGGKWLPTAGCVLGMGKLGGQELNYSSDVDLLFVYGEEGSVFPSAPRGRKPPKPVLANHQFFNRLAEAFTTEMVRFTPEGSLYRTDLRLRPEGESGPLSRSIASYETYYAQWGQTWERMMLIKARCVAGAESLGAEFLEMVQPFRYPRSINENILDEIAAVKARIENEVVRAGEMERNVKLGRGGIREIEFIVQGLQVLQAGRQPFLQGSQTLPALEKLAQYELLSPGVARLLAEAYRFLRDVEHRLQMEADLQTHTIPEDRPIRQRLAMLMGMSLKEFEAALLTYRNQVRRNFERLFKSGAAKAEPAAVLPSGFAGTEQRWKEILSIHSFREPDRAIALLREFVEGPGYVHVSQRTSALARELLSVLFQLCPSKTSDKKPAERRLSDPDRVLTRLDSFISAYGARGTLFELWNSNRALFELLLLLFDRSEFLANLAIRTPDLVDELVTSGRLRQRKTADETLRDLRHGLADKDQHAWLRRYHQAELMRIGSRDILGLADFEQYLTELSALADACLQYSMEVVMRRHHLKTPPFVIIGLGKLGGAEIDYGSDLDVLFVTGSKGAGLAKLTKLAVELTDLLSRRTEDGLVFHIDARLRPDGEKGLLVNSLQAHEDYYRRRAHLWEIQSLTRTRAIAGDPKTGEKFQKLAAALTDFRQPPTALAAYSADWRAKIHHMRLRIEKERTPPGKDALAIKTGKGGLVDAEFVAQALALENGWQEASTLRALQKGIDAGCLRKGEQLIENYRRLRKVEGILRRWSFEGEVILPEDAAPFYRVAVRCGFETSELFRQALTEWRSGIRAVYDASMSA